MSYKIAFQTTHTMKAQGALAAAGYMNSSELQGELERLHPESFGWALCCCRHQRQDAEEALHTAYVKVLEGKARFDGQSSFRTWFFGVVRHTAAEQRRRRWLRDALLMKWYSRMPAALGPSNPQGVLGEADRQRELRVALDKLPQRQRDVLHLVFYQEMTVEEAARTLQISLGTARTHFERGKGRLRQVLASKILASEEKQ